MSAINRAPHPSVIALLVAVVWASDSHAVDNVPEDLPPGFGATLEQEVGHDSNPFRLPDGVTAPGQSDPDKRGDTIFTTRAKLRYLLQREGNRLALRATPAVVRLSRFDQLNHVRQEYGVSWQTKPAEGVGLDTAYVHSRLPSDIAEQQSLILNMVTTDRATVDLLIGTNASWQFLAGLGAARYRNSTQIQEDGDRQGWNADLGTRYRSRDNDTIDVRYRHTRMRYTELTASPVADNAYKQNEVSASTDWQLTGTSKISARIGYLLRDHENFPQRDFNGWSGNIRYIWRPNDISTLRASLLRQLGEVSDASASYAKTTGVQLSYDWMPGARLTLTPKLEWRKRDYSGFSTVAAANDYTRLYGLSVRYAISPFLALSGSATREKRDGDDPSRRYSATFLNALVSWQLR